MATPRLARRRTELVVHPSHQPLPLKLRGQPNWVRIYDDGQASVLIRRTPQTKPILERFHAGQLRYPDSPGAEIFLAELDSRTGNPESAVAGLLEVLHRWPNRGEIALTRKLLIERAATEFVPDPKAGDSAESLSEALEVWLTRKEDRNP